MYTKLRGLRVKRNIPVKTLANLLGLKTEAAYYKKETGTVKFTLEEATAIAHFFSVSVEDIFLP